MPIIFFNAPEIFQPTPFMVGARRTRTNKNNSSRVMLVKPYGNAYPRVAPPNVGLFLQQRNGRERFLALENEQKSNEIAGAKSMRGSEREKLSVSETPPPTPWALFIEPRVQTAGNKEGATASSRWPKMGPRNDQMASVEPRVRPSPASPTC
jgi:hypothetical protein